MELCILGSGSKGNATWLRSGDTTLLVDAGLPPKELRRRAAPEGIELEQLSGIVLTHAHGDHAAFAASCSEAFDAPVYLTESTRRGLRLSGRPRLRVYGADAPFRIGCIDVAPTAVPHDAPQVALVLSSEGCFVGIVTDLGTVPSKLAAHLSACTLLLLESNYDPALLASGPYPQPLKDRVAGSRGHLSNEQAAELVRRLGAPLEHVVLVHLSERNNEPTLAEACMKEATHGRGIRVTSAAPVGPLHLDVPRGHQQLLLAL